MVKEVLVGDFVDAGDQPIVVHRHPVGLRVG
jgi:hypothetical protein